MTNLTWISKNNPNFFFSLHLNLSDGNVYKVFSMGTGGRVDQHTAIEYKNNNQSYLKVYYDTASTPKAVCPAVTALGERLVNVTCGTCQQVWQEAARFVDLYGSALKCNSCARMETQQEFQDLYFDSDFGNLEDDYTEDDYYDEPPTYECRCCGAEVTSRSSGYVHNRRYEPAINKGFKLKAGSMGHGHTAYGAFCGYCVAYERDTKFKYKTAKVVSWFFKGLNELSPAITSYYTGLEPTISK